MNEEFLNYNRIKRERIRKRDIQDRIVEMRKNLPVYTLDEIREYRMPYYEALVKNFEEKGFFSSASFLEQLVKFQNKAREEAGPGSNIWMRPQLQYSKKELKYLSEELRKTEEFHFAENHTKECDSFLRLGIHFAFSHTDWWWLGEQILVQSINVSGNYESLQGLFEALSRFAYAKFLIKNLREYDTAKEQLTIARELARDKGQKIETYFPDEKGNLYMQINYYTYECLIKEVKRLMKSSCGPAIEVAIQARKRAAEACYKEGETEALLMKGMCELNIDEPKSAILSFNKAIKLQESSENKERLCQIMIQLAKAYLMDNKTGDSLRVLNALKDTAAQYELPFYLVEAYKNLGEYYLNNGQYSLARRLLKKSLNYIEEEEVASSEVALVQILEAIAWGLELFPAYVDLIYNSDNSVIPSGIQNINKLIDWKDSRKPFWDEFSEESTTFADMLAADHQIITKSTMNIERYKKERQESRRKSHKMKDETKPGKDEKFSEELEKQEEKLKQVESVFQAESKTVQIYSNVKKFIETPQSNSVVFDDKNMASIRNSTTSATEESSSKK